METCPEEQFFFYVAGFEVSLEMSVKLAESRRFLQFTLILKVVFKTHRKHLPVCKES